MEQYKSSIENNTEYWYWTTQVLENFNRYVSAVMIEERNSEIFRQEWDTYEFKNWKTTLYN